MNVKKPDLRKDAPKGRKGTLIQEDFLVSNNLYTRIIQIEPRRHLKHETTIERRRVKEERIGQGERGWACPFVTMYILRTQGACRSIDRKENLSSSLSVSTQA